MACQFIRKWRKRMKNRYIFNRKQTFSIRKFKVGVVSALIGVFLVGAPSVAANENDQSTISVAVEAKDTATEIASLTVIPSTDLSETIVTDAAGDSTADSLDSE